MVLGEELEGGKVEVLCGLKDGELVVVDGQFLLDAERKVKQANLAMFTQEPKDQSAAGPGPKAENAASHDSPPAR